MARRGPKRRLDVEPEYWRLVLSGVGTVDACRAVGIGSGLLRCRVTSRGDFTGREVVPLDRSVECSSMGVLVDYFAADSDRSARLVLSGGPEAANLPYVDCKGWIDDLDALAAELSGRDLSEFGDGETIAGDGASAGVERMAPEVVTALAAVDDVRLREYAEEELLDEFELERLTALRDLAREAVRHDQGMYRWACV